MKEQQMTIRSRPIHLILFLILITPLQTSFSSERDQTFPTDKVGPSGRKLDPKHKVPKSCEKKPPPRQPAFGEQFVEAREVFRKAYKGSSMPTTETLTKTQINLIRRIATRISQYDANVTNARLEFATDLYRPISWLNVLIAATITTITRQVPDCEDKLTGRAGGAKTTTTSS
jgi:hypothetical protein